MFGFLRPNNAMNEYTGMLQKLDGSESDQIVGLDELINKFTYNNTSTQFIQVDIVSQRLVNLLSTATNTEILTKTAQCIFSFLESNNRSTRLLIQANALEVIAKHLQNATTLDIMDWCISSLHVIAKYRPQDIGEIIGIEPLLHNTELYNLMQLRSSIDTISRITSSFNRFDFLQQVPKILEFAVHADGRICEHAISSVEHIVNRQNPNMISVDITKELCSILKVSSDPKIVANIFKMLSRLSNITGHISIIIQSDFDYENILLKPEPMNNNKEFQQIVLIVIHNILPIDKSIPKPRKEFLHKRPPESIAFCETIQPVLLKVLSEKPLAVDLLLLCICKTITYKPVELTEDMCVILLGLSTTPANVLPILGIISHYDKNPLINESKILEKLSPANLTNNSSSAVQRLISDNLKGTKKLLTSLKRKFKKVQSTYEGHDLKSMSLEQITHAAINKQISKFEFLSLESLTRCTELVKESVNYDLDNMDDLAKFTSSLLSFVSLQTQFSISSELFFRNLLMPKRIEVNHEEEQIYLQLPMFSSFSSIESWYNNDILGNDWKSLYESMDSNPELKSLIDFNSMKTVTPAIFSNLCRTFHPGFKSFYARVGDSCYSYQYPIFHALCDKSDDPFIYPLIVNLIDGSVNITHRGIPENVFPELTNLLILLKQIKKKSTTCLVNDVFDTRIHNMLSNPTLSIGRFSRCLSTIFYYPFLFHFKTRHLAFKFSAYDPYEAAKIFLKEFPSNRHELDASPPLKICIHRDSVFNDGVMVFDKIGRDSIRFEISFYKEQGIGHGPTHEFFTLFSQELCLVCRGLFRSDNKEGYCTTSQGLFFSPSANPKLVEVLGVFIAKAILMDCILDMDFNPAFFRFLRGKKVDITDVDQMMANSLNYPEGLYDLPFVYPGCPNIKLITNGDNKYVDETNYKDYIELVKSYTCGDGIQHLRVSFIKGFNSVIPFKMLKFFTDQEMCDLLRGDRTGITEQALKENVQIQHGYSPDSQQIQWFFEILLNMSSELQREFIQFVTGFIALPIGGLSSINPKLTLARTQFTNQTDPDTVLPTVMTCTNYLKIPAYSSKEIMENMLYKAIQEGKIAFLFT